MNPVASPRVSTFMVIGEQVMVRNVLFSSYTYSWKCSAFLILMLLKTVEQEMCTLLAHCNHFCFPCTDKGEGILGEGDLPNLLDLLRRAIPHWRNVGVYLGFHSSELDIISRMPLLIPEGPPGFFREMLSQWLKWAPPKHPAPTVLNLASALRRTPELKDTAFQLENVFGINGWLQRVCSL